MQKSYYLKIQWHIRAMRLVVDDPEKRAAREKLITKDGFRLKAFWRTYYMTSQWKSEAEFQAACFKWFDRNVPEQRGRLMLIYNNPPNAIVGGMLISMGLRKGITDHLWRHPSLGNIWIEYKILGKKQSDAQREFQKEVEGWGDTYVLITEKLDDFIELIKTCNL